MFPLDGDWYLHRLDCGKSHYAKHKDTCKLGGYKTQEGRKQLQYLHAIKACSALVDLPLDFHL